MKTLAYWSSRIWRVEFSYPDRFRKRLALGRNVRGSSGWACIIDGSWFSVYREGNQLRFQRDAWSCSIQSDQQCLVSQDSPERLIFSVKSGEEIVFQYTYRPPSFGAKVDVTYDALDMESDDFFIWLCQLWNDSVMQEAVLHRLIQ